VLPKTVVARHTLKRELAGMLLLSLSIDLLPFTLLGTKPTLKPNRSSEHTLP